MLRSSHDEPAPPSNIRSRRMLAMLAPAQRRVLEAFYAGHLPAGQLCAALDRAKAEPAAAVPAPVVTAPARVAAQAA
jgi:hypothetical protein